MALAASLSLGHARESLWEASSGKTPDQISNPWDCYSDAPPAPHLIDGALRLETEEYQINQYYIQFGGGPERPLAMPTRLVIEARMRLIRSSQADPERAPAIIAFTLLPGVGSALNIDAGEVFLFSAGAGRGPSANVDTTLAPHTYRIEVSGLAAGSEIKVFYDGQQVLTGTTWTDVSLLGDAPRVLFGDGALTESGTSDWYSFYHNALAPAADEHVLYGGIGDHLVALDQNNGMATDLGPVSGIPSGSYIRTLAPSPDGNLFATIDPASGYYPSLAKIDPAKLEATIIGQIADATNRKAVFLEGLYYNAMERQLYGSVSFAGGSASTDLVTLNPSNAVATVVCSGTYDMDSIAFDDDGSLIGFDVFYAGGGSYNTTVNYLDRSTCAADPGFWFTSAAVNSPALDRQTGRWYFSAYDARRLDRGAIAESGLSVVGTTHSSADFGGAKLLAMAFPYDYAHPYLRLTAKAGPEVGWPTLANWSYQLQSCPDIGSPVWGNVGEPVPGTGETVWVPVSASAGFEFYRVRVEE